MDKSEKRVGSCSRHVWNRAPLSRSLHTCARFLLPYFNTTSSRKLKTTSSGRCPRLSVPVGRLAKHERIMREAARKCTKHNDERSCCWELQHCASHPPDSMARAVTTGDVRCDRILTQTDLMRPECWSRRRKELFSKALELFSKVLRASLKDPPKRRMRLIGRSPMPKSCASSASDEVRCRSCETKEELKRQYSKINAPLDTLSGETCAAHSTTPRRVLEAVRLLGSGFSR